jgi:membrane associated rhomboid family serine protease
LTTFTLTGDGWRLLSSVFLHVGLVHLLLNMYMLLLVGRLAERWFGQAGTLAIYLLGGVWASYASACWLGWKVVSDDHVGMVVSVGASGAIMALCGAVVVAAWLHDDTPPLLAKEGGTLSGTSKVLVQTVVINVVMGFVIKGVDQAAHLGGLVAGALLGLAVSAMADAARAGWLLHRRIVVTALVAVTALYGCLWLAPWSALREWRVLWDKDAAEQATIDQQAEEEKRTERDARQAEAVATKARNKAADALRATLPAPVSEQESAGQAVPVEDAAAVARVEAEFVAPLAPRGVPEDVGAILPRQGPADGLFLSRPSALGLLLARPGPQEASPEVVAAWTLCDAEYMGQVMEPGAAWHDGAGRQLVAALGKQPVVSVTDLATGVELGMYRMPGDPDQVRFSTDGKRLLVGSHDSDGHLYLNMVDIARRMREADARRYIPNALICGWEEGSGARQAE